LEALRGTLFENFLVERAICEPAALLLDVQLPHEGVRCTGRALASLHAQVRIVRGCEGTEILLLLVAAILAYGAPLRPTVVGLLIGTALSCASGAARLTLLFWTLRFSRGSWEAVHGVVAPLLPVICVGLYFLHWLSATGASSARAQEAGSVA
ncbi:MAG TPA: hypothetical protein VJQ47_13665, partial [Steroidobacteraceae bacterium]|nr:hypothetical protein [Steroidobacteraceae bacterium]